MNEISDIVYKLQQVLITLQMVEIKATYQNLQCMLGCQNTIEELKEDVTSLREKIVEKEDRRDESDN